ncbi:MAG: thioredoxin family protein [Chloroflexota bacterium]|jgi:small redox-active disulfide protein 2
MITVKILGTDCPNCQRLEAETRLALAMMEPPVPYELVKVTDFFEIADYGLLSVPGLVLNEKVLCNGRIPSREQIAAWVQAALQETTSPAD